MFLKRELPDPQLVSAFSELPAAKVAASASGTVNRQSVDDFLEKKGF